LFGPSKYQNEATALDLSATEPCPSAVRVVRSTVAGSFMVIAISYLAVVLVAVVVVVDQQKQL